jgi:hypothetical protein
MTSLQRFAAEIIGALVLSGAFFGWWKLHNHEEQQQGAQACIQQTTVIKSVAVEHNAADESAQADQLKKVVEVYDAKLALLSSGNDDLVRRLRQSALRSSAVSGPSSAASRPSADRGLPASEGAAQPRPDPISADTRALIDACDADYSKMIGLAGAYNDWRARMLKESDQLPAHTDQP